MKIAQYSSISLGSKLEQSNEITWISCFLVKQHNSRTITCTAEARNCCLVHLFIAVTSQRDVLLNCSQKNKLQYTSDFSASPHSLLASPQKHL